MLFYILIHPSVQRIKTTQKTFQNTRVFYEIVCLVITSKNKIYGKYHFRDMTQDPFQNQRSSLEFLGVAMHGLMILLKPDWSPLHHTSQV